MASMDDALRELKTNISWYLMYSNYNDTMYWRQLNLLTEMLRSVPRNNFLNVIDTSNVIDSSPILKYGTINCSAPGKEAYMDSAFSCALFQLPYFLENIQFGYLCFVVIIPIMLISIFGKIKESYRWFLLNQAIWDIFMCYSFICEKPTVLAWSGTNYQKLSTCFYTGIHPNFAINTFFIIIKTSFRNAPYVPLFLLAFSRCISLYFPKFYQRHNKTWKIIAFILIFDIIIMLISSSPKLIQTVISFLQTISTQNCFNTFCTAYNNYSQRGECRATTEKFFQCQNQMDVFYNQFQINDKFTRISINPFMFCIVLICVILLLTKISLQLKYQLKHNRNAFLQTTKVAAVIFIQSITLTIYLTVTSIQTYLQIDASHEYYFDATNYKLLSPGIFLLQNYATTTSINIMRIFFDSFIVLTVLSGYRKIILNFFAFFIKNIRKRFRSNNSVSTTTKVESIR